MLPGEEEEPESGLPPGVVVSDFETAVAFKYVVPALEC
jgi:hypothetical protein